MCRGGRYPRPAVWRSCRKTCQCGAANILVVPASSTADSQPSARPSLAGCGQLLSLPYFPLMAAYALLVFVVRRIVFALALTMAILAVVDWAVRTRRISLFGGIA